MTVKRLDKGAPTPHRLHWRWRNTGGEHKIVFALLGNERLGILEKSSDVPVRVISAPELERRIDVYLKYYDGYGAIIVQMNVEDTRNGVAEYLIDKYGVTHVIWSLPPEDVPFPAAAPLFRNASFVIYELASMSLPDQQQPKSPP